MHPLTFSNLSVPIMIVCLTLHLYGLRCDRSNVTIHSSVSKTALKEQQPQQGNQKSKPKDIANFSLYTDFTCDVHRIQHHQVLSSFWIIKIKYWCPGLKMPGLFINTTSQKFGQLHLPLLSQNMLKASLRLKCMFELL